MTLLFDPSRHENHAYGSVTILLLRQGHFPHRMNDFISFNVVKTTRIFLPLHQEYIMLMLRKKIVDLDGFHLQEKMWEDSVVDIRVIVLAPITLTSVSFFSLKTFFFLFLKWRTITCVTLHCHRFEIHYTK